ncbi:hypothetical protein H4R27_001349 [Coemansia aciculifera]|nr:hypothetical protein H4R27_001349 [Coemansia aciculifera]
MPSLDSVVATMANDSVNSAKSAIGFLQKKNRFYGWNRCLFLLDLHGLALLSSDSLFRASGNGQRNSELPFQVIGNFSGYDLRQVARIRPKQLIEPSDMSSVTAQNAKDIVVVTKSSGTLVLRAQTSADRNAWLHGIQSTIASYATRLADMPELHNNPGVEVCPNPAVVVPRAAPYIPTWTMSSSSVNGSIANKLKLGLSGLELGLHSSIEAEVPIQDPKRAKVNSFSDGAATQLPLSAVSTPGSIESPLGFEDFDASAFFTDVGGDSGDFPPPVVTSVARSKSTVYNRTRNFTASPQTEALVSSPAPPKITPVASLVRPALPTTTFSALVPTGGALAGPGSMDFGSMFDFLLEPRTESASAHAAAPLRPVAPSQQKVPETLVVTPQPPQTPRQGETLAQGPPLPLVAKQPEVPAMAAATLFSGFGSNDVRLQKIESVGYPLQSTEPVSSYTPSRGLASAIAAEKPTEPTVVLTSSIADYAGSLLENMGLADWSRSLEPAPGYFDRSQTTNALNPNQVIQSGDPGAHVAAQQQATSAKAANQQALASKLLNSPEHHRLGGRNAELGKSTVTTNSHDAKRLTFDGSAVGLSGIQTALLSKYSDSLSSSRSLLPGIGRASRPKSTHDWRTKMGRVDGQHIGEQSATLIQYAPVEPTNTGINKVIRGQIAKDIIQKEAESRPPVRRMRRVKSEAKVAPLKSIRLRLDGSAVGSHTSISHTRGSAKRGMSYVVKDGLIRDAGGRFEQRLGASQTSVARAEDSKNPNTDVFGEFNEIQARLRMAEENKRQQQRANITDREGADDVRIADIIENRQDIPLAAQLEERRKMQLAKQQVLIQQQLAQQHQQMEQQRAFLEQQQQHQLFKRQSLHPSLNSASQVPVGAAVYAGQQSGWQGYGGGNYADQWVQQQGMYGSATPTPAQFQSPRHRVYQNGQPIASVSEASYQSVDIYGRALGRSSTTNARLQPGAALYKHVRPSSATAQSLHSQQSRGSSESWQSRAAPSMSTGTPARANTEINFDGSDCSVSPKSSIMPPPRRTLSFGLSSNQRPTSLRPGSLPTRQRAKGYAMGRPPPVPPLPQAGAATSPGNRTPFQEYAYPPLHGPPGYMVVPVVDQGGNGHRQHAYSGQWAVSQSRAPGWVPQHGPLPPSQAVLTRHSAYVNGYAGGGYPKQASESQMLADMHKISKKRTEMAANTPSLLQRLDNARTSGVLPGRHIEKQGYTQGAYQNRSATQQIRDASSAQYLGDGNTLLIDRVYESEKSRSAFLKKISRTYTGIGGDVAPATTFTH